ncbi:MAG TPA: hypothetical protein VI321_04105 [Burkholderiales bacterium]
MSSIWLTHEGMSDKPGGGLRAIYRQHQWEVDGASYFRLDCTAKVNIYFERGTERSTAYGPYTRFSMVNGLAYGDNQVIAFMDYKTNEWLYYDTGYRWPVMVVNGS